MMRRHLHLIGSTLRTRSLEEKARIVEAFLKRFGRLERERCARRSTA